MKRNILLLALALAIPAAAQDFSTPGPLVDAAVERHPALARLRAEAAAARERVEPAGALPNPMVMGGVQNKMVDFSDDEMMTMYMVGASQTLTRGDKRESRRTLAALQAAAVEKRAASLRAEIERDVRLAWTQLAATDAALDTTSGVREMLEAMIAAARVRYEVGTSAQSDVIRAQLQLSSLDREILALRGSRQAALARLLPLLGLPLTTEVPPVKIPEGTDDIAADAPSVPGEDHPALAAIRDEIAAADEQVRLARLALRPDVDIEAQYGYRRTQRDMFSVVARVELPFRKESTIEPRVREAVARRDAAKLQAEELRLSLTQALAAALAVHEETTRQLELHHDVLVPQARLAFDSTLAAYQTGKAPFDAILTTATSYLRLQLQYFDFLSRHAQAVVNYEALLRGARAGVLPSSTVIAAGDATSSQSTSMSGM